MPDRHRRRGTTTPHTPTPAGTTSVGAWNNSWVGQVKVGTRIVEWSVDGPDSGIEVVFFHGTPQGMQLGGVARQALLDAGARIIAFARPGYGQSTRRQGRRVVDVVEDLRAVLD